MAASAIQETIAPMKTNTAHNGCCHCEHQQLVAIIAAASFSVASEGRGYLSR
jgi:hypothetical protein